MSPSQRFSLSSENVIHVKISLSWVFLGVNDSRINLEFFITGLAAEDHLSGSHILQSCILQGDVELGSGSTVRILVHLGQCKGFMR